MRWTFSHHFRGGLRFVVPTGLPATLALLPLNRQPVVRQFFVVQLLLAVLFFFRAEIVRDDQGQPRVAILLKPDREQNHAIHHNRCACVSPKLRLEWVIESFINGIAISHHRELSSRASARQLTRSGGTPETGMAARQIL